MSVCDIILLCSDFIFLTDVQGNCPPGFVHRSCGSPCDKFSCDDYPVAGNMACAAICVDGCFCPYGLLRFRDRCVVAQECPSLLKGTCYTTLLHSIETSIGIRSCIGASANLKPISAVYMCEE